MSDTCSLFPPFGDPWPSYLLPSYLQLSVLVLGKIYIKIFTLGSSPNPSQQRAMKFSELLKLSLTSQYLVVIRVLPEVSEEMFLSQ